MTTSSAPVVNASIDAPLQYEKLAESFNQALIHTLRKHSIADTFLDYWVPDADPVLGIAGMADSARIAGHSEIAIQFRASTIPDTRLPELEQALKQFAKVTLERHDDEIVIRATAMSKQSTDNADAKDSAELTKPSYWQAEKASESFIADAGGRLWDASEHPEFGDVHPHFRSGLKMALANLSHEAMSSPVASGRIRVTGREGTINLILDVDGRSHIVATASHSGATKPSERSALDLFCRAAEGLPIQEVADHVGPKILNSLVDDDKAPPMRGVLLPINAGVPFSLAPRLARQAYDSYRAQAALVKSDNFYYAPPSTAWQKLTSTDRRDKFEGSLRGFLQSEELYPDDMQLQRLEKTKNGYEVRAVITFSERIKVEVKPFLLRRLEKRVRRDIEPELELIAERAKDSSPLRRLS